jgi:hypothetical protein
VLWAIQGQLVPNNSESTRLKDPRGLAICHKEYQPQRDWTCNKGRELRSEVGVSSWSVHEKEPSEQPCIRDYGGSGTERYTEGYAIRVKLL